MSNSQHLSFHFLNINSFFNKKNQVKNVLTSCNIAFLALVESHIDPQANRSIKIPGYIPYNFPHNGKSSGILIYVRNGISSRVVDSFTVNIEGNMSVFIDVSTGSTCIRVGTIYLRPNCSTNVLSRIFNNCQQALQGRIGLVLGDFNLRHKLWGDTICSPRSSLLVNFCKANSISILNSSDCRGTPTHDSSVIDLCLTNKPSIFSLSINAIDLCSDHSPLSVRCALQVQSEVENPPPKWKTSGTDWTQFGEICELTFPAVHSDIDSLLSRINENNKQQFIDAANNKLVKALEVAASMCMESTTTPRRYQPQPNPTLTSLNQNYVRIHNKYRRIKHRIKRRIKHGHDPSDLEHALTEVGPALAAARAKWEAASKRIGDEQWHNLCAAIEGANKQVAWKIWHRTIPTTNLPLNSVTLSHNDPLPYTTREALDNMATFSSRIMSTGPIPDWSQPSSPNPDPPPPPTDFDQYIADTISNSNNNNNNDNDSKYNNSNNNNNDISSIPSPKLDSSITLEEVERACSQGNLNTAPGLDHIPAHFLRYCPPIVYSTIRLLFDASWSTSTLACAWKTANSFCIYKKGNRSDPSSYRIISITSVIIRAFERIVKERLTKHLEASHFFHPSQAGFRCSLSTVDNIHILQRDIHTSFKNHKRLPVVFLDIIKAFDRVPHDRLLYKLYQQAGITGRAWGWLRSFLSDRSFCITQGSLASQFVPATAGVPQGAVLSPLLFIIYINDLAILPPILRMTLAMFADDVAAWPSVINLHIRSQVKQMRLFLKYVSEWSEKWKLEFSLSKSNLVTFTRKRFLYAHSPLRLCSSPLSSVSSYKYLGVHMDDDGRSNTHVDAIFAKAKHTAYLIGRISNRDRGPSPLTVARLIKAVLIPQITYSFCFLYLPKFILQRLNQLIASPLRRSLSLNRHASAARLLWEFGIPDANTLLTQSSLLTVNRSARAPPTSITSMLARDIMSFVPPSNQSDIY